MTTPVSTRPTPATAPGVERARPGAGLGATVWLTGLPSAGKSTLARAVAAVLAERGVATELLDGDETRAALSPELGFSRADRGQQVARVGWVAHRLARHGVVVLAPLVSPYAADRDALRALHTDAPFLEVHVAATAEVCAGRDVKGLYAKAYAGELTGMTGVDDPYEPPAAPELVVPTGTEPLEASVARVLGLLAARGVGAAA